MNIIRYFHTIFRTSVKKEQKKIRNGTDQMDKRRDENERLVKFYQWGSF